jgi:hypothetical protein
MKPNRGIAESYLSGNGRTNGARGTNDQTCTPLCKTLITHVSLSVSFAKDSHGTPSADEISPPCAVPSFFEQADHASKN